METSLKAEINRRATMTAQDYAGIPPIGLYWLVVEHATEIHELVTARRWSFRRLALKFGVAPDQIKKAVLFISENEEVVASKNWQALQEILFAKWPDFHTMEFYKNYVATGDSTAYRKNFKEGKKKGRRPGSKNKPKAPLIEVGTASAVGQGSEDRAQDPSNAPSGIQATPAEIVPSSTNPARPGTLENPASTALTPDSADLPLLEPWAARRAREIAAASVPPGSDRPLDPRSS